MSVRQITQDRSLSAGLLLLFLLRLPDGPACSLEYDRRVTWVAFGELWDGHNHKPLFIFILLLTACEDNRPDSQKETQSQSKPHVGHCIASILTRTFTSWTCCPIRVSAAISDSEFVLFFNKTHTHAQILRRESNVWAGNRLFHLISLPKDELRILQGVWETQGYGLVNDNLLLVCLDSSSTFGN